ncbi:MAG: hypothetical protein ACOZQL_19285 [Myxococcota bacterium]
MFPESAVGQLALLLGAIYLLDCLRWVARNATVFRVLPPLAPSPGGLWQIAGQFKRALVFGFPLPPFGAVLTAEDWPFIVGAHGVRFLPHDVPLHAAPTASERFVPWSEVAQLRLEELSLVLQGVRLHTFGSRRAARAAVALLSSLAKLDAKAREKELARALEQRFDVEAVRGRLKAWRPRRLVLGVANVVFFLALFGLLLAAVQGVDVTRWMVGATLASWLFALVATVVMIRALEPEVRPSLGAQVVALVSPVSLMRSHDLVEPEWVAELHPAAVAAALLPKDLARAFVSERLRAAEHPVRLSGALDASDALKDDARSRELHVKRYRALLETLGGAVEPPKAHHCPRCLTEYTAAASVCDRCPGVALS